MRIAVDGMGGDKAPFEIVKGSVEAADYFAMDAELDYPPPAEEP